MEPLMSAFLPFNWNYNRTFTHRALQSRIASRRSDSADPQQRCIFNRKVSLLAFISPDCNDKKKKKKVSCNWACSPLLKQAKFCINTWKVWARTDAHEKRLSLIARRSSIINCHKALKEVVKTITVIRINPLTDLPGIFFFFLFHLSSFVFQQLHLI